MEVLVGFVFVIMWLFGASVMNGLVLSVLWGWFVVPVFNAPHLSIASAIGLSLVVSYLTHRTGTASGEKVGMGKLIGNSILYPLIALFLGWIIHFWM